MLVFQDGQAVAGLVAPMHKLQGNKAVMDRNDGKRGRLQGFGKLSEQWIDQQSMRIVRRHSPSKN